ncbi:MAG: heavy-metal-associated domain-containing protein, partial [Saprospiraceae bacterium]
FNIAGRLLASVGSIIPMLAIFGMVAGILLFLVYTLRGRRKRLETIRPESSASLMETDFKVVNMVCEGCAEKITSALSALPGVEKVKAMVFQKQVRVIYNPDIVKEEELKSTLSKNGFTVLEV